MKEVSPPSLLERRYAAMFVDGPNICYWHPIEGGPAERLEIEDIDWDKLFDLMLDSISPRDYNYVGMGEVYHTAFDGRKRTVKRIRQELKTALVNCQQVVMSTTCAAGTDVDPTIVNRMWASVKILDDLQTNAHVRRPHRITILLAGGDHVYGDAIRDIRAAYGEEINLELHVFSWRSSLAPSLSRLGRRIVALDDDPPVLRRPRVRTY